MGKRCTARVVDGLMAAFFFIIHCRVCQPPQLEKVTAILRDGGSQWKERE